MATSQSFFSDVVTHRFRLRPLDPVGRQRRARHGRIHDRRHLRRCAGRDVGAERERRHLGWARGELRRRETVRSRTACASSRDWSATRSSWTSRPRIAHRHLGQALLRHGRANTVQFRDVLSIVVEVPFAPIVERFDGVTLIAAIAENVVTRRGKPIRIERLGRPEIKNVVMANPTRDPRTKGVELRDLYNREDAFALSKEYRPLYESRLDANLAFFDGLDGKTAWPLGPDGRHPLRDLLIDDFLILDLAHAFAPGGFLEIERAMIDDRPHESAGGRWLDDDILDELLTLLVNGGRGERFGDGVDAPTKPASLSFPYVREPNKRTDLPLPAFLRS